MTYVTDDAYVCRSVSLARLGCDGLGMWQEWEDKKFILNFSGGNLLKMFTWKCKAKMDDIKMDLTDIGIDGGELDSAGSG